jgi:acetyltransferase-like isoleucine patch superfamily enzyme
MAPDLHPARQPGGSPAQAGSLPVNESESTPGRVTLVNALSSERHSPLRNYQELYVGSRSLLHLLRYELLTFFLAPLPGLAGFALRRIFYRAFLGQVGRGTAVAARVTLRCPGRIRLGSHVFIDEDAVLDAKGASSAIHLGDSVLVGRNTVLSCAAGTITTGNDVSIGPHCYVRAGLGSIRLGNHLTIGAGAMLVSGNPDHKQLDVPMKNQVGSGRGITFGDDVWVGVGAFVLDGVTVGSGSVVGAGAVVLGDVPEYAIVAGVPARVIGSRKGTGE